METAAILLTFAQWWLYAGAAVALVFLVFGIDRIDDDARGSYIFRPLLVPGILLIWPIVLWRWRALEQSKDDIQDRYKPVHAAHGPTWAVLAIVIPSLFLAALLIRQTWPGDAPAVQLQAPAGETQQ